MLDRTARTRLLCRALLAAMPDIGLPTGTGRIVESGSLPGPGPGRKGPCPTCKTIGRLLGPKTSKHPCHRCHVGEAKPHGCRSCPDCPGAKLGKGYVWYDSVLGIPVERALAEGEAARRNESVKRAKRLLRLGEPEPVRGEKWADEQTATERSVDAARVAEQACGVREDLTMWRRGSFAELLLAFDACADGRYPKLARLAWDGFVRGHYSGWADDDRRRSYADRGLELVTRRMPDPIRLPPECIRREQEERRQARALERAA